MHVSFFSYLPANYLIASSTRYFCNILLLEFQHTIYIVIFGILSIYLNKCMFVYKSLWLSKFSIQHSRYKFNIHCNVLCQKEIAKEHVQSKCFQMLLLHHLIKATRILMSTIFIWLQIPLHVVDAFSLVNSNWSAEAERPETRANPMTILSIHNRNASFLNESFFCYLLPIVFVKIQ